MQILAAVNLHFMRAFALDASIATSTAQHADLELCQVRPAAVVLRRNESRGGTGCDGLWAGRVKPSSLSPRWGPALKDVRWPLEAKTGRAAAPLPGSSVTQIPARRDKQLLP